MKIKKELEKLVETTNLPPYIDRVDAEKELNKATDSDSTKEHNRVTQLKKDDEVDLNSVSKTMQENLQDNRIENDNDNLNEEGDSSK